MTAFWIALLVVAIAGVQAAFWIPFTIWSRRKAIRQKAELLEEIASSDESIKRGPESALYRGAAFGYSRVNGNGTIALTDRRLLFRKVTGGRIDVPLEQIAGVREDKVFLRGYRSGHEHVILQLRDRNEVGFIVTDHAAWTAAVREAATDIPS